MMSDKVINFAGNTIALIVRGKESAAHHPNTLNQHADRVLPDGSPMGFFGKRTQNVSTGTKVAGFLGGGFVGNAISVLVPGGFTGLAGLVGAVSGTDVNAYGMAMEGFVCDYAEFQLKARAYVDVDQAAAARKVSTVLIVTVTPAQAAAFTKYWRDLDSCPGTFNFAGGNCSTGASNAFVAAKRLDAGVPGLDTPDHLYDQLVEAFPAATSHSGYVGFVPKAGGKGYDLVVRS
jgi:hypothetical protein